MFGVAIFSAYAQSDLFGKSIFIGLFVMSIISWTVLANKVYTIRRLRRFSDNFLSVVEEKKDNILNIFPDREMHFLEESSYPFLDIYRTLKNKTGEILQKNSFFSQDKKAFISKSDIELIKSSLEITIIEQSKKLEENLFVLSTVVTLAPFVGLLGTVWGISISFANFQSHAAAMTNAAVLGGLSLALATTVLGLVVAIPAVIAHNYLKNRAKEFTLDMESFSHKLLSSVEIQYRKIG